jgi:hypothetical protein
MGSLRKHISELLAIKTMAADEVWIRNKALDALEYRFSTGATTNESWFIEITAEKPAPLENKKNCVCLEGKSSIWVEDGFTFLGNLTGIFLDERHSGILNLLAGKIPAPLKALTDTRIISLSIPPANAYGIVIRYGTHDVCFQATFWMQQQDWINFLSDNRFQLKIQSRNLIGKYLFTWALSISR